MNKNVICTKDQVLIGKVNKPYIIAEIGTNHNRDIETARTMIKQIAESGCDCVKFQVY